MNKLSRRTFGALVILGCLGAGEALRAAATPTVQELLKSLDHNLQYDSRTSLISMTVENGKRTRTYELMSYGRGRDEAAIEYLSPERDKGTRMLRKGENLWIYMPGAERVQKISGHMLRQGMMGSDLSYEDMLSDADFEKTYDAKIVGEETLEGRPHWKLEALARNPSVTYPKRLLWIDQAWRIPTRQELYAVSGMKLKTWSMGSVKTFDGRQIPMHMEITDHLRAGSRTVIDIKELKMGVELKDEIFSMRWLERK
jgi:outer membrane lipoprotein-sorting protein